MKSIKVISLLFCVFITGLSSYVIINSPAKKVAIEHGTLYPEDYREIAPFQLSANNNTAYTSESFKNKWTLLFFGFTNCPDVCPTSLVTLQQVKQKIKDIIPAEQVDYVFISVDPKRDTLEKLDAYVTYFDTNFKGVTGNATEIKKLASSLAAFYIVPDSAENENYLVEHAASIYLIGENAKPKVLFSYPHTAEQIASDMIKLYQS